LGLVVPDPGLEPWVLTTPPLKGKYTVCYSKKKIVCSPNITEPGPKRNFPSNIFENN
jgi:hypothetical protein